MKQRILYRSIILLTIGGRTKFFPRGILNISSSGRVQIILNEGVQTLNASIKDCKLSWGVGNSWSIKVNGKQIRFITLLSQSEKVKLAGGKFKYWAHEDGSHILPDRTLESYFKNSAQFPDDHQPSQIADAYQPFPEYKKIMYMKLAVLMTGIVAVFILAFTSFSRIEKSHMVQKIIGLLLIFGLGGILMFILYRREDELFDKKDKKVL